MERTGEVLGTDHSTVIWQLKKYNKKTGKRAAQ